MRQPNQTLLNIYVWNRVCHQCGGLDGRQKMVLKMIIKGRLKMM